MVWRSRGASALLAVSFCFAFQENALASPLGRTGASRGWKPEWTTMFKSCYEQFGRNLERKSPSDARSFCSAAASVKKVDFWLSIFIPLAFKESGFNPRAKGRNGGRVPAGLFQMDSLDMRSYRCPGTNPLDAKQNICCAVKIADRQASKQSAISAGRRGILASFWQPMRSGMGGDGRGGRNVNNTRMLNFIKKESQKTCATSPASGAPGASRESARRPLP